MKHKIDKQIYTSLVRKGTSKAKKEQAEIGDRTKVGHNKDIIRTKTDYPKTEREKDQVKKNIKKSAYGRVSRVSGKF